MSAPEMIERLIDDGLIDAVVTRVKTGKEAEVFVVQKGEEFLAAKVYKERAHRSFKNDAGYKEGRVVRNTRDMRAMAKRTTYGRALSESEWMTTEHDALSVLLGAGVRVPRPELFYEGVLLMELVLAADGQPAPRLADVALSREEALAMHREIVGQIIEMLCCDLIHGDLSPFNILLAWNGPTIIDFPQVIKAAHNSRSEEFLVRDVRNVTEHFARFAPELKRRVHDGHTIWRKYEKRELSPGWFPEESAPPLKERRSFDPGAGRGAGGQQGQQQRKRPPQQRGPRGATQGGGSPAQGGVASPAPQNARSEAPRPERARTPSPVEIGAGKPEGGARSEGRRHGHRVRRRS